MHCCRLYLKFSITQRVISGAISATLILWWSVADVCRPHLSSNPWENNHIEWDRVCMQALQCYCVRKSNVLETSLSKLPLIFLPCVRWLHSVKDTHLDPPPKVSEFWFQKGPQHLHILVRCYCNWGVSFLKKVIPNFATSHQQLLFSILYFLFLF